MVVICPRCGKAVEIDAHLRRCIESIREIGCDECLRRIAEEQSPQKALALALN